jgi:hypothetical protein
VTNALQTAWTTLRARYLELLVWCKGGCQHQAEADLHGLVEAGRVDIPPSRLRFRCSNCPPANSPCGVWIRGEDYAL